MLSRVEFHTLLHRWQETERAAAVAQQEADTLRALVFAEVNQTHPLEPREVKP